MCLWWYAVQLVTYTALRVKVMHRPRNGGERTDGENRRRVASLQQVERRQVLFGGNFYRTGSTLHHFAISAGQFFHWLM